MARAHRGASGNDHSTRLFTPAFVALSLSALAYFTAFGLMIPVVPLFAAGPLGAGPAGVGIAVGAFSAMALVLRPFAGRLSDRRGRRPLLIVGGLFFAVVTAAHLIATELAVLVLLRLLLGVAEALYFVAAATTLADLAPPERLGEALSYNSLSLYLGIAVGPSLGELLIDVGGFRLAWIGGVCLALAATLLALRIPETGIAQTDNADRPLIHRATVAPGLAFLTGMVGSAGFLAFAALHARHVGMAGAGIVLGVYGLVVIGCRVVFAKLSDRIPPFRLGVVALALIAAGLVVTSVVANPAGLITGAAILALGVAYLTPAFYRVIISRVHAHQRGAAVGTFSMFVDLGLGGGSILIGLVAARAGIPAAYAAGGALAALGAAATALLGRLRRSGLEVA
jgi:predicted MFS family arabinose efflux permease